MNYLETWVQSPAARTLGWSLIHFLWEGFAIAALLLLCRRGSSRTRYTLACIAFFTMPLAVVVTYFVVSPPAFTSFQVNFHWTPAPLGSGGAMPSPSTPWFIRLTPWVTPFWIIGVMGFYLRSFMSWWIAQRIRRTGVCTASEEWQSRLRTLIHRIELSRPVVLLESCLVEVPVVIGLIRPVVLMPVSLMAGLSTSQLEAILLHELAHIRRWDYLVNLLQNVVEGLLFYHPAVWWVSNQIRAERENCCDDVVVALTGNAREYAAALATLEQNRWPAQEPALAASGGSLMNRIRRLLQEPPRHRASSAPAFVVGLLVITVGIAAGWQSKPTPAPVLAATATVAEVPAAPPAPQTPPQTVTRANMPSPYQKWMTEDVAYIITDEERNAFKRLPADEEKEHFIEQFWLRRDPTPGTPANEMKEEHYRRIAYTNEHYSSSIAGWKTDRGRVYITYGPPDEIDSHPSGGAYQRTAAEGGGTTNTAPFEQWKYRYIADVGKDVVVEFVDAQLNGEYRMTLDPHEKELNKPTPVKIGVTAQILGTPTPEGKAVLISVPVNMFGSHNLNLMVSIFSTRSTDIDRIRALNNSIADRQSMESKARGTDGENHPEWQFLRRQIATLESQRDLLARGRPVANYERTVQGSNQNDTQLLSLAPGTYHIKVVMKDNQTNVLAVDDIDLEVK